MKVIRKGDKYLIELELGTIEFESEKGARNFLKELRHDIKREKHNRRIEREYNEYKEMEEYFYGYR